MQTRSQAAQADVYRHGEQRDKQGTRTAQRIGETTAAAEGKDVGGSRDVGSRRQKQDEMRRAHWERCASRAGSARGPVSARSQVRGKPESYFGKAAYAARGGPDTILHVPLSRWYFRPFGLRYDCVRMSATLPRRKYVGTYLDAVRLLLHEGPGDSEEACEGASKTTRRGHGREAACHQPNREARSARVSCRKSSVRAKTRTGHRNWRSRSRSRRRVVSAGAPSLVRVGREPPVAAATTGDGGGLGLKRPPVPRSRYVAGGDGCSWAGEENEAGGSPQEFEGEDGKSAERKSGLEGLDRDASESDADDGEWVRAGGAWLSCAGTGVSGRGKESTRGGPRREAELESRRANGVEEGSSVETRTCFSSK
jgi:hypothetical protein